MFILHDLKLQVYKYPENITTKLVLKSYRGNFINVYIAHTGMINAVSFMECVFILYLNCLYIAFKVVIFRLYIFFQNHF